MHVIVFKYINLGCVRQKRFLHAMLCNKRLNIISRRDNIKK